VFAPTCQPLARWRPRKRDVATKVAREALSPLRSVVAYPRPVGANIASAWLTESCTEHDHAAFCPFPALPWGTFEGEFCTPIRKAPDVRKHDWVRPDVVGREGRCPKAALSLAEIVRASCPAVVNAAGHYLPSAHPWFAATLRPAYHAHIPCKTPLAKWARDRTSAREGTRDQATSLIRAPKFV
jgi:hypothetical protein